MPFARDVYTASASQTDFTITFSYIDSTDVLVYEDGTLKTVTTDYTLPDATTVRFNSGLTGGEVIVIQRASSQSTRLVTYTAGALRTTDLNNDSLQAFYMAQEAIDIANIAMGLDTTENWDAETKLIKNVVDPTDDQHAATKAYVDASAAGTLGTPLSVANGGTAGATEGAAIASLFTQGTDIASAAGPTVPTDGSYFDVTGTDAISSFVVDANRLFILQFDAALTLTHGASIDLPGDTNITTAAGDHAIFYATAANTVKCIHYHDENVAYTGTDGAISAIIAADNAWTGNQYFTAMSDSSSSGSITIDFTDGNYAEVTLTENITSITLNNIQGGGVYKIRFKQDASSVYTITGWPATVVWTNDDADPTMNTTLSSYTMVTIEAGTTQHLGSSEDYL